jgi:septum formation topological specificity factor MinE
MLVQEHLRHRFALRSKARATAGMGSVTFSRYATYAGDFPTLRRDLLDAVPRFIEIEQGTKALHLFEQMNITALKIFDLSLVLQVNVVESLSVVIYDVDTPAWAR